MAQKSPKKGETPSEAKKPNPPASSPSPTSRRTQKRIKYLKDWVARVRAVLAALEAGDPEPAKALARESIEKNEKMLATLMAKLEKAAKT